MSLLLITAHAAAATGAFVTGVAALRPERGRAHRWLLAVLVWTLVAMVAFVVAAILSHWNDLQAAEKITFPALVVLALYMVRRARLAQTAINTTTTTGRHRYLDSIGFVLIALSNGFVIVAALDLGAPVWLVAGLAVGVTLAGHRLIADLKRADDLIAGQELHVL